MGTEITVIETAFRDTRATMESHSSTDFRQSPARRMSNLPPYIPSSRRSSVSSTTSSRLDSLRDSRGPEDLVETLYNHPSVKIIAFTATLRSPIGTPNSGNEPAPGTLPASSHMERTIAVGQFRIYRAPGSVAFLSCGSALQPILPKSQCWCIDEANSRFVLQIRRPQFWRIEVPVSDPEDAHRAFILREVFEKVLQFEKTECPFQRSFTVELPERPPSPVKKPWTPAGKNLIATPFSANLSPPSPSPRAFIGSRRSTTPSSSLSPFRDFETSTDGETDPDASIMTFEHAESTEASVLDDDEVVGTHPVENKADVNGDRPRISADDNETKSSSAPNITQSNISVDASAPATQNRAGQSSKSSAEPRCAPSQAYKYESPTQTRQVLEVSIPKTNIPSIKQNSIRETKTMPISQSPALSNAVRTVGHTTRGKSTSLGRVSGVRAASAASRGRMANDKDVEKVPKTRVLTNEMHEDADDEQGTSTFEGSGNAGPVNLKKKRMSRMLAGRSGMSRPLTLVTSQSQPPKSTQKAPAEKTPAVQSAPLVPTSAEISPVGSVDSFHSVQSWHSPQNSLPPSPPPSGPNTSSATSFPFPHNNITLPAHKDISRITPDSDATFIPSPLEVTDNTDRTALPAILSPVNEIVPSLATEAEPTRPSSTEPVVSATHPSAVTERRGFKHRRRTLSFSITRRGLSPLPPAANLFTPPMRRNTSSRIETVAKLPGTIINKTVEILLSPPSHLVNLMLKVAAKIAAGEWRGLVFGVDEGGEKIPVQWDYSDGEFSSWSDDDDYTFSLGRFGQMQGFVDHETVPRSSESPMMSSSEDGDDQTWEVD